jgi:hypothetical protein
MFHDVGLNWTGTHGWAYCAKTQKCYDIECPEGVLNPFELPFFRGYFEDFKKRNEALEEEVSLEKSPYGQEYKLYHNPTKEEFTKVYSDANGTVRGLIDHDGDMYVWDASIALHSDVDDLKGLSKYMAFIMYPRRIEGPLNATETRRDLRAAFEANETAKAFKFSRSV